MFGCGDLTHRRSIGFDFNVADDELASALVDQTLLRLTKGSSETHAGVTGFQHFFEPQCFGRCGSRAREPLSRTPCAGFVARARQVALLVDDGLHHFLPVYATRQTVPEPSSVTIKEPSLATATPAGRPHTLPSGVTKPTRKSSYSPVALPSFIGTRITL